MAYLAHGFICFTWELAMGKLTSDGRSSEDARLDMSAVPMHRESKLDDMADESLDFEA